jgi:hypothetical protein
MNVLLDRNHVVVVVVAKEAQKTGQKNVHKLKHK